MLTREKKGISVFQLSLLRVNEHVLSIRSSCSLRFFKNGALKDFVIFAEKHPRWSLLFKVECNFIKKETLTQVLSCEYCGIFKNSFFIECLGWLLLLNEITTFFHLTFINTRLTSFSVKSVKSRRQGSNQKSVLEIICSNTNIKRCL